MLEMFFSFQYTKYDENRWLNTKLFKKRDVNALKRQNVYSALLCDESLQMGPMGPKMTLGTLAMSWYDFPGV